MSGWEAVVPAHFNALRFMDDNMLFFQTYWPQVQLIRENIALQYLRNYCAQYNGDDSRYQKFAFVK